jgi:5-methylcytosine-specific restriction endonuclease McrA
MRTRKTPSALRRSAWLHQSGRCFYCELPIWLGDELSFCRSTTLSPKQAKLLQCTAEHLKPWSEGGANERKNIVAACAFCNRTRHRLMPVPMPEKFRSHVQQQMSRGKWHQKALLERVTRLPHNAQ